jgi:uncharacterized YccA/Bax inhibitor family protein
LIFKELWPAGPKSGASHQPVELHPAKNIDGNPMMPHILPHMVTSNPLLKREASFSRTAEASVMDLNGTVNKTGILLLICAATAAYAWYTPALQGPLIFAPLLGGLVFSMIGIFKPATSPFVAPCYAALEGLVLGAISGVMNVRYQGIAANAVLLTFSVLALFLFLYATRIVRVTNGMRVAIIAATGAICVMYLLGMILHFFGISIPFLYSNGWLGIGVSLFICGIAAFNFFLDFDAIEGYIRSGSPKYMEWYSGMALLINMVWLYLEILRLLSKLQNRR